MVDSKGINSFVNYNYKALTKSECIKRIFCIWIFGLAVCLLGRSNTIYFAVIVPICLVITILISISAVRYLNCKGARFLCDGTADLFYSIMLNLASYRFYMIFQPERNIALIILSLLSLPISILCYLLIVYRNIKLDKYNSAKANFLPIGSIALIGGAFGIFVAKNMIKNIDQNSQVVLVSIILLFLSILVSIGSLNFLKYFLWRKYGQSRNA